MKKWKYWIVVLAVLSIMLAVWICVSRYSIGRFSLVDYQHFLSEFPCDEVVGPVEDARTARQKAFALWSEIYGKEEIEEEKPFTVCYDEENDAWLVNGSKPIFALGGSAHVIIRASDGQVLALWHEK